MVDLYWFYLRIRVTIITDVAATVIAPPRSRGMIYPEPKACQGGHAYSGPIWPAILVQTGH